MGLFSNFFGKKQRKLDDFFSRDAVIIDVRSKAEYDSGAIPGSKHIPVQNIAAQATTIKKWNKPVICVCASGGRSATAAAVLRSKGIEAMNGGGWLSLYKKMIT
ncbi:rhodanese-like domain-containing protein [Dokdonia sp. PRO95]|uniref:rhodanese-like domain-containing protein n=1 Tax=Dokdonia sp. PRO95 TaxID=1239415 RepID=UPI000554E2B5|nr:rhodanese-like domain-containing protein [Dokdonia sp. PRO95]